MLVYEQRKTNSVSCHAFSPNDIFAIFVTRRAVICCCLRPQAISARVADSLVIAILPHLPSTSTLGHRSTAHRGSLILSLPMSGREISPGTVITLTDGRQGTVRFIGTTTFAVGDWIGVELTDATGKNDGAVQGERYFECEPGFGMFIRPTAIGAVIQQPPRESKQSSRAGPNSPASRQSISAGVKKPSGLPPAVVKRQSINATGTPTPAPKVAPPASLRVCLGLNCSGWPLLGY